MSKRKAVNELCGLTWPTLAKCHPPKRKNRRLKITKRKHMCIQDRTVKHRCKCDCGRTLKYANEPYDPPMVYPDRMEAFSR